jgi:hypothetical protein
MRMERVFDASGLDGMERREENPILTQTRTEITGETNRRGGAKIAVKHIRTRR